jgi:exonuclease SbcC
MIPIRLTLRNFLSYGEACDPLEFGGLHVACLSGANGGGKSALLDAITWALWGKARSNTADDLVRLGQSSMLVEFDFAFDGAEYRVVRKRTRGRAGQSDLQFQVKGADGVNRALTEQGVLATQERITQMLRMDYETFVNSAFLLQGRADEFARKSAAERKRILAEILGLRTYDELVEAAKARAREAETRRDALELEIARGETELAREPEYEAKIEACRAELDGNRAELDAAGEKHRELLALRTELEAKQHRYEDLSRRLQLAGREIGTLRLQLAQAEEKVRAARDLLARAEEIRGNFERLQFARKRLHDLGAATTDLRRLESEKARAEGELMQERGQLATQLQLLLRDREQLQAKEKHLPTIQAEIRDLERAERAVAQLHEELAGANVALQESIRRQAEATGRHSHLTRSLKEVGERFELLRYAGKTALCPVCGEELSEEKRQTLGREVKAEKLRLAEEQAAAAAAERLASEQIACLRHQIEAGEGKLQTLRFMTDRLAHARQKQTDLLEAVKELPTCQEQIRRVHEQIETEAYGDPVRERLARIAAEIQALGYSEEEHRAVHEEVARLAAYEREQLQLERAEEGLQADEQHAASLQEMIEGREAAITEDRAACVLLETELKERGEVASRLREVERALERLRVDQARVTQDLGAHQDKRERCRALRQELKERRAARDQAVRDRTAYQELARIFGRDGIQALIIENAIPEIEQEANRILARMSDNGMRVTFRTQKDTKTAGVAETLEIDISDSAGTRKYELFSGGEAFRANFAIRVALSKLLARRAGARLQTLVIDEGFGSQDLEGRDRLIEAIDSIRDDFEKILVVTHLDELKEFFPARIEVTKNDGGSQVMVLA